MVRLVTCHDCFFENGQVANLTRVVALSTYRVTIREEQDVVSVCADLLVALGAAEAVHVPELGAVRRARYVKASAQGVEGKMRGLCVAALGDLRKVDDACVCRILIDDESTTAAQDVHEFGRVDAELRAILVKRYRSSRCAVRRRESRV